jgi:hypothetical protein
VRLIIKAGPQVAYLPNFFGDWDKPCQSGFSVDICTLKGKRASKTAKGYGFEFLGSGPAARELLSQYVFLKPGESRTWHTTITGITKSPGTYEVKAEYLSAQHGIEKVADLTEVHGLMVVGHIPAKPVLVFIQRRDK